jgi:hypothetical protein
MLYSEGGTSRISTFGAVLNFFLNVYFLLPCIHHTSRHITYRSYNCSINQLFRNPILGTSPPAYTCYAWHLSSCSEKSNYIKKHYPLTLLYLQQGMFRSFMHIQFWILFRWQNHKNWNILMHTLLLVYSLSRGKTGYKIGTCQPWYSILYLSDWQR